MQISRQVHVKGGSEPSAMCSLEALSLSSGDQPDETNGAPCEFAPDITATVSRASARGTLIWVHLAREATRQGDPLVAALPPAARLRVHTSITERIIAAGRAVSYSVSTRATTGGVASGSRR